MSNWTYISGVIEVSPRGRTKAEKDARWVAMKRMTANGAYTQESTILLMENALKEK